MFSLLLFLSWRSPLGNPPEIKLLRNHLVSMREFQGGQYYLEDIQIETIPDFWAMHLTALIRVKYGESHGENTQLVKWHFLIKDSEVFRLGGFDGVESFLVIEIKGQLNKVLLGSTVTGFGTSRTIIQSFSLKEETVLITNLPFGYFRGKCKLEIGSNGAILVRDSLSKLILGNLKFDEKSSTWFFNKNNNLPKEISSRLSWEER